MNKNILTITICAALLCGCATKQIITVTPLDTNESKGVAVLYDGGRQIASYNVLLGRNGVADIGAKREGDGKTPSGIYPITTLFGKSEQATFNMPYLKTSENIRCVDDTKSQYYNRIVDTNSTKQDYDSYEDMLRQDGQYDIGAVVAYNKDGAKGLGSCIFLHISNSDGNTTAGCISLKKDALLDLLSKLDAKKEPTVEIYPKKRP